ncbi:MAG: DUF3179 domain-containing (seleno)protein [Gemmatimonas sp.]
MKKWFVIGAAGLILFEFANVYFIMPLPFSQRVRSIDVAYALYTWRWAARALFGALMLVGLISVWRVGGWRRWLAPVGVLLVGVVAYATNVVMAADHLFLMPRHLRMVAASANVVEKNRLVVGVVLNGDARAYPVQFIGYHHQVRDSAGGEPILVTFCTVCRTGRVFSPIIDSTEEQFRLVGMDHFNAMLEDRGTGSWWRQANGEAITGSRKGAFLREIPSQQVTLALWLEMHPASYIMQADSALRDRYPTTFDYETGQSRSALTGTDSVPWSDKAWVVGLTVGGRSKAYDWRQLRRERVINDVVGGAPIVVLMASDDASFFAYQRRDSSTHFTMRGDSLIAPNVAYGLSGRGASGSLVPVQASQEFWHSWRTFQPGTERY